MSEVKRTLLIVEDEPELRELLAGLCRKLTPHIKTAGDGHEALEHVASGDVDAILSDINMPRMTGLELLQTLRLEGNEVPFIILSGYGDKKNTAEALRFGATDFLDKPFENKKLLEVVDISLQYAVAMREAESELENIYKHVSLEPEKLLTLKKAHKTLWLIKKDWAIRYKKVSGA